MNHLSTMAKTVEYLARGIPVVAVDLVETHRTAQDAGVYVPNGWPSEFAEAIDALLNDESRRLEMRRVGLSRFAELLSWDRQAEQYVSLWHALVPTATASPVGARLACQPTTTPPPRAGRAAT